MIDADEIKQRIDIVDYISRYTPLTKAGRQYKGLCPFHTEKTASFYVYPDQGSWHCYGACSTGGDVISFLMKKENLSFLDAVQILGREAGVDVFQDTPVTGLVFEGDRVRGVTTASAAYHAPVVVNCAGAWGDQVAELAGVTIPLDACRVQVAYFRLTGGKRLFRMAPLHHHFELMGWAETQVVIRFWIIAVIFALAGLSTLKLR